MLLERNLFHHISDAEVIYEERTGRGKKVENGNTNTNTNANTIQERTGREKKISGKWKFKGVMSMQGAQIENVESGEGNTFT